MNFRVRVVTLDGDLNKCPQILCENAKEAEHLAATLALYDLCKGQVRRWRWMLLSESARVLEGEEEIGLARNYGGWNIHISSHFKRRVGLLIYQNNDAKL